MPEGYTDEQLREAASEAGISPIELRQALVEREGGGLMRPPPPGAGTVQATVALAAPAAITAVRRSIEENAHRSGHAQGEGRYDIVDDDLGLTYRVTANDDGDGLSVVRIDVDTGAGRGALALAGAGTGGVALTVVCIGWLFSLTTLWLIGLGIGALGGLWIAKNAVVLASARRRGVDLATHALNAAQETASRALEGPVQP